MPIANKTGDSKVAEMVKAVDAANEAYLDNDNSPSRKVGEPDNKASHYYYAKYWAEALANSEDKELADKFAPIAKELAANEDAIIKEMLAVEGNAIDAGGYYMFDDEKATKAMRPSETFNKIIDAI